MKALVLLVLVLLVAIIAIWVAALVVAIRTPAHFWPDESKSRWVLRIFLGGTPGAIIFFTRSYPRIRQARQTAPPETKEGNFSAFDIPWDSDGS